MNIREGTRRLALLLGVLGALFGGFVSALQLQELLQQRRNHERFERVSTRIAQLGKQTQMAYPSYADMEPLDLGLKVLAKYPEIWPWVTGSSITTPLIPQPTGLNSANETTRDNGFWDKTTKSGDLSIWGITTPDGQTFLPAPAPNNWMFLWVLVLPALGFFIPWGAVHSIGWVLKGYIQERT